MPRLLARKIALAELHCHLGGAVTPAIMWGIAHAQGIRLPNEGLLGVPRHDHRVAEARTARSTAISSSSTGRSSSRARRWPSSGRVYEVVGGAYRKNNVTTMELRFNPMKRNRGGEQDLDHIIAAAVRGMDKASLEYPVKPGLIFCLDRAFPYELNEILVEKAIAWRDRGVVGVDIAGPESATFRVADYRRLFRRARQFGLGITVHTGEVGSGRGGRPGRRAAGAGPHRPRRQGGLRPAHDGDDPRARHRARDLPHSNLNTRVVSGWDEFRWIFDTFRRNEVRFTINTDGPEMLKTYIRDEMATLGRLGILSVEDQEIVGRGRWRPRSCRTSAMSRGRSSTGVARGRGARRGVGRYTAVPRFRCGPARTEPPLRTDRAAVPHGPSRRSPRTEPPLRTDRAAAAHGPSRRCARTEPPLRTDRAAVAHGPSRRSARPQVSQSYAGPIDGLTGAPADELARTASAARSSGRPKPRR